MAPPKASPLALLALAPAPHRMKSLLRSSVVLLALATLAPDLQAQPPLQVQGPGEVLYHGKISRRFGGGPAELRPGDQFGRGADTIGDLDGDGILDLVVGSPKDDGGGASDSDNFGAVWILFMHADGTVREYTKIGRYRGGWSGSLDRGDEFGRSVAALGDHDGDGIPDLAVGACYDDDGGGSQGAVWIFFLERDGSVRAEQKISATAGGFTENLDSDDQFGRALLALGDLDGDGTGDLLVGAIRDDDGGYNIGAAYVLFLHPDGTVRSSQKISATKGGFSNSLSERGEFGFDGALLGDLDGDGVTEIAIASPDQKTDGRQEGAVFLLYLNSDGTVKSDHRITEGYHGFTGQLDHNDEFGACVTVIGDVDGDGVGDLAVGAGKDDDGEVLDPWDRGAVWILLMNSDGTVHGQQKISDTAGNFTADLHQGDRFGTSLAPAGDQDGDGTPDLFVGCRFDDDGGINCGAMYLLYLSDGVAPEIEAHFTATPRIGAPPRTVRFSDQSIGSNLQWSWDFGDGTGSTEQHPIHDYLLEGEWTVSLTVTDDQARTDDLVRPDYITTSAADPQVFRLGCGENPVESLTVVDGTPKVGTTVVFGIDNPLGTQTPGALTVLYIALSPDAAYPCGMLSPGNGMAGGDGAILINTAPPNPVRVLYGPAWTVPGTPAELPLLVPMNSSIIGLKVYAQGYLFDPVGSVRVGLTDGLELTLY
jgi:PKD repeat protein